MKKVALLVLASMFCVLPFVAACGASSSHSSTSSTSYRTTEETVPAARVVPETSPSVDEIIAAREASAAETSSAEEVPDVVETEMEAEETTFTTVVPEVIDTEPTSDEAETVPETAPSPQGVDYHNFINGTTFDLTAYAEALGCRRVQDPNYPEMVMYAISNHGITYFFIHAQSLIQIYFGDKHDKCWQVGGITTYNAEKQYVVSSIGQSNYEVSSEIVDAIGTILNYLATTESVNLFMLPSPTSYNIDRREGQLNYYSTGAINRMEWGSSIPEDCYSIEPQEGKVYKTDGRVDITGAVFDPTTL